MGKKLLVYAGTFGITLLLLWGCLTVSSCISNDRIYENIYKSMEHYEQVDEYQYYDGTRLDKIADNYADMVLLNIIWNVKDENPVITSLDTKYYDDEEEGKAWGLRMALEGREANQDYTRYWHGSMMYIRPLLLFTDAAGIKVIVTAFITLLVLLNCAILLKKKQYAAIGALLTGLVGVRFWNISMSLEYQPTFLVCFLLCPFYILLEKKGDQILEILSVTTGVMVAFLDFLTTETITILVPLLLVLFIRYQDGRLGGWKENFFRLLRCGICWFGAYGTTFLAKWIIVSAATGENKLALAFQSAGARMAGTKEYQALPLMKQIPYAVLANLSTLFGGEARVDFVDLFLGLGAVTVVAGSIWYLLRAEKGRKNITVLLLFIGLIPYVRYLVLNNHSYLHEFFTFRAQLPTIMALCGMVWFNLDTSLIRRKSRRRS